MKKKKDSLCFRGCFGRISISIGKRAADNNDSDIKKEIQSNNNNPTMIREFRWEEIERLTDSFAAARVIGSGGFSTVYEAPEIGAAVKVVYGRRVFSQELDIFRRITTTAGAAGIVKLLGHSCHDSDDQLAALVLEYVPNGTLQEVLDKDDGDGLLPWQARISIARQVAAALHHLHHHCGPLAVVHGDLKPANVLLDRRLNAVLCDFGSAKTGFSSGKLRAVAGSPGYADPHYLRTGIPSKKNDVYSFGVLLIHLVTGETPFCRRTGQLSLHHHRVDHRLPVSDHQEAAAVLALAERCLTHPPALRPCSSEILQQISSLSDSPPHNNKSYQ